MPKKQPQISDIQRLISDLNLSQVFLASKMPMPIPTFKNKLNPRQAAYGFTDGELNRLVEVLREMAGDIKGVCGR